MSVAFQRIKNTIVFFFVLGLTQSAYVKKGITCYVCTPNLISDDMEASEIYNTFPNYDIKSIPTCGSNTAINFTLKCPDGFKGCLTKTYGKNTLKTCNAYPITDCKIANNVKYCFCADNLCNYASVSTSIPNASDDEDLDQSTEDGSGLFDDWAQSDKHKYTNHNIKTTVTINDTSTKNITLTNTSAATSIFHKNISVMILILTSYKITLF